MIYLLAIGAFLVAVAWLLSGEVEDDFDPWPLTQPKDEPPKQAGASLVEPSSTAPGGDEGV